MSDIEARLRIDITTGQIEVSGTETFVTAIFPSLRELLMMSSKPTVATTKHDAIESPEVEEESPTSEPAQRRGTVVRKQRRGPVTIPPIPVQLKGDTAGGIPALRQFIEDKQPDLSNAQELTTVCAFYLQRHVGLSHVLPGHLISCYNEVEARKPTNLPKVLINVQVRKGWLQTVPDEKGAYTITVAGENLVNHDLPRGKKGK